MKIVGDGVETYLYLTGIELKNEIEIDENIVLLPAKCEPDPNDIIKTAADEMTIGISAIFLRNTSAQLRIIASNEKEIAINAWNSTWDVLLMSAILNCEIGFNIQSNVKSEEFNEKAKINVTNFHLRGLIQENYKITDEDSKYISRYLKIGRKLIDNDRFQTAVHSMATFRWHTHPRIQLAIIWSGIESLFKIENEISFRISLYIANFIGNNDRNKTQKIFNDVRSLYKARSSAVHGCSVKGDINKLVVDSSDLLKELIRKSIETGMPEVKKLIFSEFNDEELI